MADTSKISKVVEQWYLNIIQKERKNYFVSKEKVQLTWGGVFEYDVVVKDKNGKIIELHCLSVGEAKTASGKGGSGKFNKIKSDTLMLLGADCKTRVLAFTGKTMYDKVKKEMENGRMPPNITLHFQDPKKDKEIYNIIKDIQKASSDELL